MSETNRVFKAKRSQADTQISSRTEAEAEGFVSKCLYEHNCSRFRNIQSLRIVTIPISSALEISGSLAIDTSQGSKLLPVACRSNLGIPSADVKCMSSGGIAEDGNAR